MLNDAVRATHIVKNPIDAMDPDDRYLESGREAFLTPDEIARLRTALDEHSDQTLANGLRLLIYTGTRPVELRRARWGQFDLSRRLWVKPSSATKHKKDHRLILSMQSVAILADMKASADKAGHGDDDDLVFRATAGGELSRWAWRAAWHAVKDAAKLRARIRVYDLRHTVASLAPSLELAGAMLGHTSIATTQRYFHIFDDDLRAAVDQVGAKVSGTSGEVVDMASKKGAA